MRSLVTVPVLLLVLLGACGGNDDDPGGSADEPAESPSTSSSAAGEVEITPAPSEDSSQAATGDPSADPCDLLTKDIAEEALGVPVGSSTTTPGEGNETCSYAAADGTANVLVLLTIYNVSGADALDAATAAFPDAKPVPDLGDRAVVSRQGHAIGVAVDDLVFAMSLLRADSFSITPAEVEAQMVDLAHAVVDAN